MYNPGWRYHPNLKWSDHSQPPLAQPPFQNSQQRKQLANNNHAHPPAPSEPSLEELVRQMTMQNMQFQKELELPFKYKSPQFRI
ncbi:hypothetical protein Lal_00026123 [Lupinus albus]|nr:hypothetical protein Lal_00026123 [Lupinus albus]